MACSLGRPSRRKKEPGIFPAAYMRSSTSTVRGKKSIPSRMPRLAWAVTRTVVSPTETTTAPSACWARRPVEKVRDLPDSPMGADAEIGPVMVLLLSSLFQFRAAGGRFPVGMLRTHFVEGRRMATDNRRSRRTRFEERRAAPRRSLPAETEPGDERPVPLDVVAAEVVEQATSPTDEHQEPPAGVMILLVDLQVRREHVDPLGEERDLHLR